MGRKVGTTRIKGFYLPTSGFGSSLQCRVAIRVHCSDLLKDLGWSGGWPILTDRSLDRQVTQCFGRSHLGATAGLSGVIWLMCNKVQLQVFLLPPFFTVR